MADQTPHTPWTVNSEVEVFVRAPFLKVIQQDVTTGTGQRVDDFYKVILRNFSLVVPVLENGKILLIRQYKHGPGRTTLGFPAGFLEPGEAPETGAARELMEETGLIADEMIALGSFVDNGNQRGALGHYFIARRCTLSHAPDPGDLEEFEYLEMTPEQIDKALLAGEFGIIHHAAAWGLARLKGV